MRPDVFELREFYHGRLGRVTRNLLRARIRTLWPDVRGLSLLGLGYATPYLGPFQGEAERVLALMPAPQGVVRWPAGEPGLVALTEEHDLPVADASIDRVLMVHELENTERARGMLREAWRVLASGGRLLVVVPNRRGLWAQFERTPFGQGRPYSPGQLSRLLREAMFQPTQRAAALWVPPAPGMLLKGAGAWERVGRRVAPGLSGVLMVEADKQIYAVTAADARQRRRRPIPIQMASRDGASSARDDTRSGP